MSVWDHLVGQEHAVEELRHAAAGAADLLSTGSGTAMTHAWLFTGPPGSGRSTAATAFAAALQCERGGCGHCPACRTTLGGTHADVRLVSTAQLSHKVDDMRALVQRAARHPSGGRWEVIVLEDADRLTEHAANALLKAIEEPTPRTVWLLCAPTVEDVLPTVRSRCRVLALRTPPLAAVADVLVRRDGVDPAMAAFAARAAQGHIGRARRLATDEQARLRRSEALRVPTVLLGLSECLVTAENLLAGATEDSRDASAALDGPEHAELSRALGAGTTGRGMPAGSAGQLKELERNQKARTKRLQRDALDRALVDLASFYRDVLVVQLSAGVGVTNEEVRTSVDELAAASTPEATLRRVEAVMACREAIEANVAPLLALEAMTIRLREG